MANLRISSVISLIIAASASPGVQMVAIEEHLIVPSQDPHVAWYNSNLAPKRPELLNTSHGRLQAMDDGGIRISVLSAFADGLQAMDNGSFNLTGLNNSQVRDLQVHTAATWNYELSQIVQSSPDRFRAFAALPMQSPAAAAEELTRCVLEYGFVGALVNGVDTSVDGVVNNYNSSEYDVLWRTFEQLNVPLYLHPRFPASSWAGADPFFSMDGMLEGSPWGFHVGTAHTALNLIMKKVFQKFPRFKVILGHMGEFLPFWAWRIDHRLRAEGNSEYAIVKQTLQHNFFVSTSGFFDTSALQHLISVMGEDRVIYATDYPMDNSTGARIWLNEAVKELKLSRAQQEKLEFKNAAKLLNISFA